MIKKVVFSIAVAFYFGSCVSAAKETYEHDVIVTLPEIVDYALVRTDENNELYFNVTGLDSSQGDECKCKNGFCMRQCDVEKTVPCLNKTKVCTCNKEYGQKSPNECELCDCGEGFGCEFKLDKYKTLTKSCICPEDYWKWEFGGTCRPKCSEERPCKNGGVCMGSKCQCMSGTTGDLCEKIYGCGNNCRNRLEVNCLFDQQANSYYCPCQNPSLYYDYSAEICKPCPCGYGRCEYDVLRQLKCVCNDGYKESNGYCRPCECGYNSDWCMFNSSGTKFCGCKDGFYSREGSPCEPCKCRAKYTDPDHKCGMVGNVKQCFCNEGFENVLGKCEDINECETNNTCHYTAKCRNTWGSFECECPKGYKGIKVKSGVACEDIDECQLKNTYPCMFSNNAKCVNLPGSYKCECLHGYEPQNYNTDPEETYCVTAKKSWAPTAIVIVICVTLLVVAVLGHIRLRRRLNS